MTYSGLDLMVAGALGTIAGVFFTLLITASIGLGARSREMDTAEARLLEERRILDTLRRQTEARERVERLRRQPHMKP